MNFLSHYYFDRHATDPYLVMGTVLPDLLKNTDKTINIHPEKFDSHPNPHVNSLIQGWKKHLEVDRYFHNSEFFAHHAHQLKLLLTPAIYGSAVKPFFLGHIALELVLDNLLLTTGKINATAFYNHLATCDDEHIHAFLIHCGLNCTDNFFKFLNDFKKERYLNTYTQTPKIAYALKRICMRIWNTPFTVAHEEMITGVITNYRTLLQPDFMVIFNYIDHRLS